MDHTTWHAHVKHLEQKVTELLASYRAQQETIQQLRNENEQLMQQMANSKVAATNNLLSNLTTSAIAKQGTRQKDWGAILDDYIRDIEKSIAYLETIQ